eukprot:scaffold1091_cov125-Isochrysis_galbana.AAC.8
MESASASTLEMPIASTAHGGRCAPTAPATIAKDVKMPSSLPHAGERCVRGASARETLPPAVAHERGRRGACG